MSTITKLERALAKASIALGDAQAFAEDLRMEGGEMTEEILGVLNDIRTIVEDSFEGLGE